MWRRRRPVEDADGEEDDDARRSRRARTAATIVRIGTSELRRRRCSSSSSYMPAVLSAAIGGAAYRNPRIGRLPIAHLASIRPPRGTGGMYRRLARIAPPSRQIHGAGAICRIGGVRPLRPKSAYGLCLARFRNMRNRPVLAPAKAYAAGAVPGCWDEAEVGWLNAGGADRGADVKKAFMRRAGTVSGRRRAGGSAAPASAAQPQPWEITLQPAASPIMEMIHSFNNGLLIVMALIVALRPGLLVYVHGPLQRARQPGAVEDQPQHADRGHLDGRADPDPGRHRGPSFSLLFAEHDPARAIAGYDPDRRRSPSRRPAASGTGPTNIPTTATSRSNSLMLTEEDAPPIRSPARACSPSTTSWSCRSAPSSACRSPAPT